MRVCLKQVQCAVTVVAALGLIVPRTSEAGPLSSAISGAMSAASRGGSSLSRAASTVRSSGSYQRLKSSVSGAGRSALTQAGGLSGKARQAVTSSGTMQRLSQSLSPTGATRQALGRVNQQFTQQLSKSGVYPAMSGAFGNARQSASSALSKAATSSLSAVQRNMGRAVEVNRSVFSQFQQKAPAAMMALAAPNGNTGIAGIAAQGQPLDSLSNLANAMKAKAGIQGPIIPPAIANQLKQSEVLKAMATDPRLSNAKTQFVNRLQASGVDVNQLKTDLNKVLATNQPLDPNPQQGLAKLLADVGIIPQPDGNIDFVGNPPVLEDGGIVPLPPDGFDPVDPANPPAPPANPPVNPQQVDQFPWEQIVANIPLYLALADGLDGGGGGGGSVIQSGPVYQQAPVEEIPAPAAAEQAVEEMATVDVMLEDVQLAAPATVVAGPAYLVTLRNQSTIPIGRFQVAVMAGPNGGLNEAAPHALTEVALMQPGEAKSVLLRLPNTAMQMVSGGQATPFTHLFVGVDAMDGLVESDETNNTAILERTALEGASN